MVVRLRKRVCLGKEYSILAVESLVGALQMSLQFEMVTDMFSFYL